MKIISTAVILFAACASECVAAAPAAGHPQGLSNSIAVFAFVVLLALAVFIIKKMKSSATHFETLDDMKAKGLLKHTKYTARRAFQIEEFEDEGSQYMIELADGSVLFLIGQYFYQYEPITDDGENNQPRRFPCTEFTVVSHQRDGYSIDVECGGKVLEPECLAPAFDPNDEKNGSIPEDGQIFTDRTYDQVKRERMRKAGIAG